VPGAPVLTLTDVTADNWRGVADLAPRDDQRDFVPALAARYLLLGLHGGVWHNLGAFEGDTAVAHVMWAVDPDDGTHWIGGLLVDARHQGRGVGRRVVEMLVARLRADPACHLIRMSHHPGNDASRALFASLGFVPTGEEEDGELVMELAAR
jgi:diamine N-acetyltransferase